MTEGLWRLRVGKYRVYYHQEESKTYVLGVVHLRNAYRENIVRGLQEFVCIFTDSQSLPYFL
ncbi:MAG: type II toxin-antitoxin system RelE family toxin [Thermoplasmatota archaeon]